MNNGIFGSIQSQNTFSTPSITSLLGNTTTIPSIYGSNQNKKPEINYDNLVFVIDTTKESNNTFILPLAGSMNCIVDWGDGTTTRYTAAGTVASRTKTYASRGEYIIQISGRLSSFQFNNPDSASTSPTSNQPKLIRCLSFGNVGITNFNFRDCTNLIEVPNYLPTGVTSLKSCFWGATLFNQDIESWDTSRITIMANTFAGSNFTRNLNGWNTSKVTDMSSMFSYANFNGQVGAWDTSKVTTMGQIFQSTPFNGDISSWNVSAVTSFARAFWGATKFNQNLGSWNTQSATDMTSMFWNTPANYSLSGWDVSNVTNMNSMFGLSSFNNSIAGWNTSNVTDMGEMFRNNFNHSSITGIDTSAVTTMGGMFYQNSAFNQPISNWNVGKVTNFGNMFYQCPFNQSISGWNIGANIASGSVISMAGMFYQDTAFNQNISSWDVSKVNNFSSMFQGATAFNQPLSGWNIGGSASVTTITMSSMFNGTNFNQSLSSWNVSKVNSFSSMFAGSAFNGSLSGWQIGSGTGVTSVDMGYMLNGASSFNNSVADWTFYKPTSMTNSFYNTASFNNSSITGWINTSGITNIGAMFYNNRIFNQPIGSWDTRNVTNMGNMFNYSLSFNQSLNSWNVGKVTTFGGMFVNTAINQDFSNWTISGINAANGIDLFMQNVTTMSTTNYDNILVSWESKKTSLRADLRPHFGSAKYSAGSAAATARAALVTYGWTITDGGSI